MSKAESPPPPTEEDVAKHLKAQSKSVFQKPFTRDPCVTIVNSKAEVERQLLAAQNGDALPAYMLRNADNDFIADPLARTCDLLRKAHAGMFAGTIYGIRYVVDDMMPTVADAVTSAKPAALLADFSKAYTIADYQSMKWVVDPITEPQFVKYSARRRVGAAVVDYKAIRGLVLTAAV